MAVSRAANLLISVAFGAASVAAPMCAASTPVSDDSTKAQALATQIETSLGSLGCAASTVDDVASIQSAIAAAGVDPKVARRALRLVLLDPALCGNDGLAANEVEQTVAEATDGTSPPASGGPGGGAPLGPPPSYVGGGGSDYLPK
jgi:hypothetical protein